MSFEASILASVQGLWPQAAGHLGQSWGTGCSGSGVYWGCTPLLLTSNNSSPNVPQRGNPSPTPLCSTSKPMLACWAAGAGLWRPGGDGVRELQDEGCRDRLGGSASGSLPPPDQNWQYLSLSAAERSSFPDDGGRCLLCDSAREVESSWAIQSLPEGGKGWKHWRSTTLT